MAFESLQSVICTIFLIILTPEENENSPLKLGRRNEQYHNQGLKDCQYLYHYLVVRQ